MRNFSWILLLLGLTVGETLEAGTRVVDATVQVLDADRGHYVLEWQTEPAGAPVNISVASNRQAEGAKVIATDALDSGYQWDAGSAKGRQYFFVTPTNGRPFPVASRVLPLQGGRNFRDLGGYRTMDGSRVKWGKVFRSGVMDGLTDNDYDYLASLGIRTVCDLRAADERRAEPTDWRAGDIRYMTFPDPTSDEDASPLSVLKDPDVTPERVAAAMAKGYVGIAYDQAPAYRAMFDRLAGGEIPLAFNCSAGKDRTGIGAALLLTVLGVPRETVIADYALSDDVVDYMNEFMGEDARAAALERGSPYAFLFQMPPQMVEPLMRSDPLYIESALDALATRYGSVMTYIRQELNVTDDEIQAIRAALLETT